MDMNEIIILSYQFIRMYLLNISEDIMFIETLKTLRLYERQSKLGVYHTFKRKNTLYVFRCDCCGITFFRPKSQVDQDRAGFKHAQRLWA